VVAAGAAAAAVPAAAVPGGAQPDGKFFCLSTAAAAPQADQPAKSCCVLSALHRESVRTMLESCMQTELPSYIAGPLQPEDAALYIIVAIAGIACAVYVPVPGQPAELRLVSNGIILHWCSCTLHDAKPSTGGRRSK
jgi:hypothetical protein